MLALSIGQVERWVYVRLELDLRVNNAVRGKMGGGVDEKKRLGNGPQFY